MKLSYKFLNIHSEIICQKEYFYKKGANKILQPCAFGRKAVVPPSINLLKKHPKLKPLFSQANKNKK